MNYYNEISEGYEELHKEEQLDKIRLIKKYIDIKEKDLLLDVGCGTGLTTRFWKCRVFGIDPAIELLKKVKNGFYVNAEAENIPFKDGQFDWVISITAIQNFHEIDKALKEIKRVGKNKFVLTFLKKSLRKNEIKEKINKIFNVNKFIEQDKDFILIQS